MRRIDVLVPVFALASASAAHADTSLPQSMEAHDWPARCSVIFEHARDEMQAIDPLLAFAFVEKHPKSIELVVGIEGTQWYSARVSIVEQGRLGAPTQWSHTQPDSMRTLHVWRRGVALQGDLRATTGHPEERRGFQRIFERAIDECLDDKQPGTSQSQ